MLLLTEFLVSFEFEMQVALYFPVTLNVFGTPLLIKISPFWIISIYYYTKVTCLYILSLPFCAE